MYAILTFALTCCLAGRAAAQAEGYPGDSVLSDIKQDHINFYSLETLKYYAPALAAGALLANTDLDQDIADWYQDDVRSGGSDDFAKAVKPLGSALNTLPFFAAAWVLGEMVEDNVARDVIGQWGQLSTRSMLVGFPPLLLLQRGLGASRPSDNSGSEWHPFEDVNAVSGHAFVGAVPFMTAARLSSNAGLKYGLYTASAVCGWSRINDNQHYFSQVLMGWWLALVATDAVDRTRRDDPRYRVEPVVLNGHAGVGVSVEF